MEMKFDSKKMLGFRHLPSMNGVEPTKSGVDRMYNKIGEMMPPPADIGSPVTELDRIFNKIGEVMPM